MKIPSLIIFTLGLGLTLSLAEENRTILSYEEARKIVTEKQSTAETPENAEKIFASLVNDRDQPIQVRIVAIRSLGDIPTETSIVTLIGNISLRDQDAIVTEAGRSLHKIGLSTLPAVLEALEKTTHSANPAHDQRQMDLVQAMMQICGRDSDFVKWYETHEKTLSTGTRNAIRRYATKF